MRLNGKLYPNVTVLFRELLGLLNVGKPIELTYYDNSDITMYVNYGDGNKVTTHRTVSCPIIGECYTVGTPQDGGCCASCTGFPNPKNIKEFIEGVQSSLDSDTPHYYYVILTDNTGYMLSVRHGIIVVLDKF